MDESCLQITRLVRTEESLVALLNRLAVDSQVAANGFRRYHGNR